MEMNHFEQYDDAKTNYRNGRNMFGFTPEGIHVATKTDLSPIGFDADGWNTDGWHWSGWNREKINERTGTHFNTDGVDFDGYNEQGWNAQYAEWETGTGKREGWIRTYLFRDRFVGEASLPFHKETGTIYNTDGFNFHGFDAEGYDTEGFTRYGEINSGKHDRNEFTPQGYHYKSGLDKDGYNRNGIDRYGFTRERIHSVSGDVWSTELDWRAGGLSGKRVHAETMTEFDPEGFDINGRDKDGYDRDGYSAMGWNRDDIHKETGTKYSTDGYSRGGFNADGFSRYRGGEDAFGYKADEPAPLHVFTLSGFNHHAAPERLIKSAERFDGTLPRNLKREGWIHEAGQGWEQETAQFDLSVAFTHKATGTKWNPEGFSIIGINADRVNERGFNVDTRIHTVTGTEFDANGWNCDNTACQPA